MQMKERFLNAVIAGELGTQDEWGVIVTLKEFKRYFSDMHPAYANSFLPAAVIEPGQHSVTHTRFLFRVRAGVYRVHPRAIADQIEANRKQDSGVEEGFALYCLVGPAVYTGSVARA